MSKQILFSEQARKKMQIWIKKLADTVRVTMWPRWRNVIFSDKNWKPVITNDGVTIAKEVILNDNFENMWAQMIKEVAMKTNDIAWDWTTTATILANAIIEEWMKYLEEWVNPILMKNGIDKAVKIAVEKLEEITTRIETKEEIAQVATNSAQNSEIWNLISDVIEKIWIDWVITVEDWKTFWLEKEIVEWMQIEKWYISPYMVTNSEKMEAVAEWVHILVTNYSLTSLEPLLNVLETLAADWKKELVIIAEDISWEALSSIVLSKMQWSFRIIWIKWPWFWSEKDEILKDIAILTWWEFISKEFFKLENVNPSNLWFAKKIISTKENTTIIWWDWESSEIENRISQLKLELDSVDSWEKWEIKAEKLQSRIWKLSWWIAIIKVWAATEIEAKEKKFRIEDALSATRAALSEWIIAWWWTAFVKIISTLEEILEKNNLENNLKNNSGDNFFKNPEEEIWFNIIKKILESPAKQIAENWGFDWEKTIEEIKKFKPEKKFSKKISDKILEKFWKNKNSESNFWFNFWFNALTWEIENLIEKWIIDPKMVSRTALENAASAASMFLTTEAAITASPKGIFDFEMPNLGNNQKDFSKWWWIIWV